MNRMLQEWVNDRSIMMQWSYEASYAGNKQTHSGIQMSRTESDAVKECLLDYMTKLDPIGQRLMVLPADQAFTLRKIVFDPYIKDDTELKLVATEEKRLADFLPVLEELARGFPVQTMIPEPEKVEIQDIPLTDSTKLAHDWLDGSAIMIQWRYSEAFGRNSGYAIDYSMRELVLKIADQIRETIPKFQGEDLLKIVDHDALTFTKVTVNMKPFVGAGVGRMNPLEWHHIELVPTAMEIINDDKKEQTILPGMSDEDQYWAVQIHDKNDNYIETSIVTATGMEDALEKTRLNTRYRYCHLRNPRRVIVR